MAKREMFFHPDDVRKEIRVGQLIDRLQKCVMGEIELTMQQLRAIEILLRKCLPIGRTRIRGRGRTAGAHDMTRVKAWRLWCAASCADRNRSEGRQNYGRRAQG
jgi:hypothetical protein